MSRLRSLLVTDHGESDRDLAGLFVALVGRLEETADLWEPYRLLDADGEHFDQRKVELGGCALLARRARAEAEGWLGEIEGIDLTLSFLRQKRDQTRRLAKVAPVDLGIPAVGSWNGS